MKKPTISIIVAVGENLAIGKDNKLLWNIPEDLKHFKQTTSGHPIIMGERTFYSIGKPLPNRQNIILSEKMDLKIDGAVVAHSIDEAINIASQNNEEEIFFIGGAMVYKQALPIADRLYITVVKGDFEADTFFPEYKDQFTKILDQKLISSGNHEITFFTLER